MDRKEAEAQGLTQEEEEDYYGVVYYINAWSVDEYGEQGMGIVVYPLFASYNQCRDYFDSMTHEELLGEACLREGDDYGVRFSIESAYCKNGELGNDSEDEDSEQYRIVSWEDGKPVVDWSEEWWPEEDW